MFLEIIEIIFTVLKVTVMVTGVAIAKTIVVIKIIVVINSSNKDDCSKKDKSSKMNSK